MSKKHIVKRLLNEQEATAVQKSLKNQEESKDIFKSYAEMSSSKEHCLQLAIDDSLDEKDGRNECYSRVCQATGAKNFKVGLHMLFKAGETLPQASDSIEIVTQKFNEVAAFMKALAPNDEIEGQLSAQLFVLQENAMNFLGRAARIENPNIVNIYLNGASKLLARYQETLTSLIKYRNRGEQKVHVEHVHVHSGGQAIVGSITQEVGGKEKSNGSTP